MSLADDSRSNVPPESSDLVDPLADPVTTTATDEPAEDKKGKKRKKKKEKKARATRSDDAGLTEEPGERRRRFSLSDMSVYTVMLMIAFGFLLVGCVLMWLELSRYGFDFRARG